MLFSVVAWAVVGVTLAVVGSFFLQVAGRLVLGPARHDRAMAMVLMMPFTFLGAWIVVAQWAALSAR